MILKEEWSYTKGGLIWEVIIRGSSYERCAVIKSGLIKWSYKHYVLQEGFHDHTYSGIKRQAHLAFLMCDLLNGSFFSRWQLNAMFSVFFVTYITSFCLDMCNAATNAASQR